MLSMNGQACASPATPTAADGLTATIDLKAKTTYTARASASATIDAPLGSPVELAPPGMLVKFLVLRSLRGAPMVALLTSTAGADQAVPFDDMQTIHSDSAPFSSVKVYGTGVVEYLLAGT